MIQRFQAEVNWSAADHVAQANQLAREVILGYVTAYVTGGDQMLAVYHDKNDPTSLSAQFETLLTGGLLDAVPELRTYLTEYPRASPMESFLYWSEEQFGLNY